MARKLGGNDPKKTRRVLGRIQRLAAANEEFRMDKAKEFEGTLVTELPAMAEALASRAKRGRTDAIKLALEVTGVHNPKVKHEHSGDISISLNIPRPPRVENETQEQAALASAEGDDAGIVDAEIVE